MLSKFDRTSVPFQFNDALSNFVNGSLVERDSIDMPEPAEYGFGSMIGNVRDWRDEKNTSYRN